MVRLTEDMIVARTRVSQNIKIFLSATKKERIINRINILNFNFFR